MTPGPDADDPWPNHAPRSQIPAIDAAASGHAAILAIVAGDSGPGAGDVVPDGGFHAPRGSAPRGDGPRDLRGRPIGSPDSRDVYWIYALPACLLAMSAWIVLSLVSGHSARAEVLSCGGRSCRVVWSENGHLRYDSVDPNPGCHPGSTIDIHVTSLVPGGSENPGATRDVLVGTLACCALSAAGSPWLIRLTRRQRARAWTAWLSAPSRPGT